MNTADAQQAAGLVLTLGWLLVAVVLFAHRAGLVTSGPLIGRDVRVPGPLLWGSGAAVAFYTGQAVVVDAVEDAPNRIVAGADRPVLDWMIVHRTPDLTSLMEAVSRYGGTNGTLLLAAAAVAVLLVTRRWWDALAVAVATGGVAVLVPTFKDLYGRTRPPVATQLVVEPDLSLPSGHALGAIVVIGIIAVVLGRAVRSTGWRVVLGAVAAAAVLTISLSRLYLGVHWVTDVATSWTLGGAWLAVVVTGLMWVTGRGSGAGARGRTAGRPGPPAAG
ncbi:phosphatase PAP2 family protein [Pseudonocardia alni]|uniref:phosphatase PAP2 family protein n=1 Tax=Pseudonocardia alni TaxID=33907 RepID=UPI00279A80D5|nr:phosphatase PAP2 family protein [Pseudonocardia alni]